jgi:NAD+ kinase
MIIGIIPNISKKEIISTVKEIIEHLEKENFKFVLSDSFLKYKNEFKSGTIFLPHDELSNTCDMVISIGGDGTMLHTAYEIRNSTTPILGVNVGKLGFLAEFDLPSFADFLNDVKAKNYIIEERIALIGNCAGAKKTDLYAINDIVIDKGPWPKMIELTIKVDDDYVTTFSADGLIVATPTGSTGYSLSTGGPIVNPKADVITISPIAPHTLTMRPLVISSQQNITVIVNSLFDKIRISCDGQRVEFFKPPTVINIEKSQKPVRLVHSNRTNYFEILRKKLYWGLDMRQSNNSN